MTPHDAARELAHSMRSATGRDWRAHWLGVLNAPRQREGIRRIAEAALRNLGAPQRTPGEDDA